MNIFTMGVYGRSENDFFDLLKIYDIHLFCDIRRRRGMRGSQYKFVNSTYLQSKLNTLGIPYMHILKLSPDKTMRIIQKEDDKLHDIRKRERLSLSNDFINSYKTKVLDAFDFQKWFDENGLMNKEINILFFCVEREPSACHRSLVAAYLSEKYNINVCHI